MDRPRTSLEELVERAESVATRVLSQSAERDDREALWPEAGMRALAEADLMGLNVPTTAGGHGLGLEALVLLTRALAHENPSAALCFGMHCVGTAVLAARATREQSDRFLAPIAAGEHLTTLALSEPGTGAHFSIPETRIEEDDAGFVVTGVKSFVTNGGHADSYVTSTVAADEERAAEGEFSMVVLEADTPGIHWSGEWRGFGMRGNSSRTARIEGARIPRGNLLGEEGDELWYLFEVIAPFFLSAMSGTYLGIAEAAVDITIEHLGSRRHSHTGEILGAHATVSEHLGRMWVDLESARQLILTAARRGDAGGPRALPAMFACKVAAARAAVGLTDHAMTLSGGRGYAENGRLGRLLRDARASHIMAPTTQILETWIGRSLLDIPLLQ